MKTNEKNLNTKKATITYQNDGRERNSDDRRRKQYVGENKFL